MKRFAISPHGIFLGAWQHRELLFSLVKRDVVGRYRGSFLGILWSFFHPLLMLTVYTFVFGVVFKSRWAGTGDTTTTEFALFLFAGLMVFNLFSECVTRAPTLIVANANYVKKVVFPLEILPCVALGSALFHATISLVVWLVFFAAIHGLPHITVLLWPIAMVPVILHTLGVSWLLASLGVYLRDVSQVVGILVTALLFMSPVFYPLSALPDAYQGLLALNPLTPSIELARSALLGGKALDCLNLGWNALLGALVAWFGFAWFQLTRKGFADVV